MRHGARGIAFDRVEADSRKVAPNAIFAALPGTKVDGMSFAQTAVTRGAVAVLCGSDGPESVDGVPTIRTDDPRRALALIASALHPGQPDTLVAVTGTAGKTSVASFTRQIWKANGEAAAQVGTTGVIAPGREDYGTLTTPDPVALHRLLDELSSEGVTHCAFEASSHGLDQRRLDGVRLAAGAFTNLGRDHLDYHPTIESYLSAKMRLFDTLLSEGQPAIVYADDEFSQGVIEACENAGLDTLTVGRDGTYLAVKRVEQRQFGQVAEIVGPSGPQRIELPLAGEFQLANALVSAGLAIATGTDEKGALVALGSLTGASGRLELVGKAACGAPVYVDYAHKPEALENVLRALRPYTTGRLFVVFGCGGDRDPGKRPIMGEIASRLADDVIVTDDNPRSEAPASIRAAIMASAKEAREIGDRRGAIETAVSELRTGDTLVVAGKGHEEGQIVGDRTLPFSDHAVIREAIGE